MQIEEALDLLISGNPSDRRRAAKAIGIVADRAEPPTRKRLARRLMDALAHETEEGVQVQLLLALGNTAHAPAVQLVESFGGSRSARVRLAAAKALFGCVDETARAIPGLIGLSGDRSRHVRNWSCAGLRIAIELFSHREPAVARALAKRTRDPDDEVRGEALLGLSLLRDPQAPAFLKDELAAGRADLYASLAARALGRDDLARAIESAD
jgi:HEAT repeat protein